MKISDIIFSGDLSPDLFNTIAKEKAISVGSNYKPASRQSQLRKFYDELCMWEVRVNQQPERFDELLPFIRMMNAKAVYARGRGHVNDEFTQLLSHCLEQIKSPNTLRICKTFMEAFMGFYKVHGPKD